MGFGFFTEPFKFFHTLDFQYKDPDLSRFRENKTRLSYMTLAIDVARYESTDLAIATAIGLREVIFSEPSVTCCKYHLRNRNCNITQHQCLLRWPRHQA